MVNLKHITCRGYSERNVGVGPACFVAIRGLFMLSGSRLSTSLPMPFAESQKRRDLVIGNVVDKRADGSGFFEPVALP